MSHEAHAAKRGEGVCPRLSRRCTDEFVKEPAVQTQLRIRRRHLARDRFISIENILNRSDRTRTQPLASCVRSAADSARRARALWSRGVAVVSARPLRLTPQSCMIKSKERKRCINSMSSAFSPPPAGAVALARRPPQSSCGAHARERTRTTCRAIYEVSGRTRTHLDGFGMRQLPRLCAASLSSSGNQLANSPSGVRSEAVRQHRARLSPRYGMSVAVFSAMRVDDPSAQLGQEEAE